ncbi:MAG: peptidoglycan bridge formation glycyltransferase FemA/FemB family protein [Anaerolineales bacterium]|nr:peptidoglycan bridge formation glycyltransferase FemA/FemB family protein [Anaerolineales bacterium]
MSKPSRWYNAAVTSSLSLTEWKAYLTEHPEAHLLQTTQWGELKSAYGWDVEYLKASSCGVQVLFRRFPLGITLAYIPKGPVGEWLPTLLPQLDALCMRRRAFVLKIEPDADWDPKLAEQMRAHGFTNSYHNIQPRRTLIVNLQGDEDQILGRMHQKTRYNIRLASRKGVTVRPWDDLEGFGHMMQETAVRDRFGAHIPTYYQRAFNLFHPGGACEIFVAEYEGTPLAALMVFARGYRAWYFYGASTTQHRNLMPNYLLQWEAMLWARARGCTQYDLWGVPDETLEVLEAEFTTRRGGLWGVYRFKRGFGGDLLRSAGTWDRPYNHPLYWIYNQLTSRRHD